MPKPPQAKAGASRVRSPEKGSAGIAGSQDGAISDLLACRGKTHGDFTENAQTSQALKAIFRSSRNWPAFSDRQKEGLEMIALKLSRFLTGDPTHADALIDIAGYATLMLDGQDHPAGNGQDSAIAARDVPAGKRWTFPEHRTQAEVLAQEVAAQAPVPRQTRRSAKRDDVAITPQCGI